MTARIVNLRTRRKQKARDQKAADAAERAAVHGESRADRTIRDAERQREIVHLDAHRLSPDPDDPA